MLTHHQWLNVNGDKLITGCSSHQPAVPGEWLVVTSSVRLSMSDPAISGQWSPDRIIAVSCQERLTSRAVDSAAAVRGNWL